jgi:hypothetical protein
MKIYSVLLSDRGVLLSSEIGSDFWVTLGKDAGWGRFAMLRPLQEQYIGRSSFRLVEVLPADSKPPVAVVDIGDAYFHLLQAQQILGKKLDLPTGGTLQLSVDGNVISN